MAVLNKAWGSMDRVSAEDSAVVTGEDEGEDSAGAVEAKPMDRPLMVYVTDGVEYAGFDKIEKVVLMDDKVCIGMWAFHCVKMTPEAVEADELLADAHGEGPCFIFVSRDRSDVKVIGEKDMKAKKVFAAMTKFAKKAYGNNLKKVAGDVLKVLGEFDKINNQRRVLKEKIARNEAKGKEDKKSAKKLDELDELEKEMNEKRDELLKFEVKAS